MERLVITGYGVKCPNGYNNIHLKTSLEKGEYELSYVDRTMTDDLPTYRTSQERR